MRTVKLSCAVFILALLVGALAAPALAANPEFLDNVTGNTFTATIGEGRLTSGALTVICKKAKITLENGKVTAAKTLSTVVDFEKCSIAGLIANSLGDPAGTILVAATGELCYTNKAGKLVDVLFNITPVHIEIPSLGELIEVKGTVLGLVVFVNFLSLLDTITISEQSSKERCEGGTTPVFAIERGHNGKPEAARETASEELTFDKDTEVMA
jgi:hypothetical protein